jgi:phage gpG-like protein
MTLHEFETKMTEKMNEIRDFSDNIAPAIVGNAAVEFYKKSFINEGFTDRTLEKWKPLKRPKRPKRHKGQDVPTKILVEDKHLSRSLKRDIEKGKATVHAEALSGKGFNYAPVHNWGDDKINVPQRMFVGPSDTLEEQIKEKLEKEVGKILRK